MPDNQNVIPQFVRDWFATIEPVTMPELVPEPERAAFFSADLINGFVHFGPLSSPRVNALVDPVVTLFTRGWEHGITKFVLLEDAHQPDSPEFRSYPPHALAGTDESATIPEIAGLPFAEALTVIKKRALGPAVETNFDDWWDEHIDLNRAIVVGDCTDLCIYSLAMHLRMRANALGLADFEVIVPVNAVDTFDIPVGDDTEVGRAHPAEFFHQVFLYHMASNGIRVVSEITANGEGAPRGTTTS